jgi:hypothetical protein
MIGAPEFMESDDLSVISNFSNHYQTSDMEWDASGK